MIVLIPREDDVTRCKYSTSQDMYVRNGNTLLNQANLFYLNWTFGREESCIWWLICCTIGHPIRGCSEKSIQNVRTQFNCLTFQTFYFYYNVNLCFLYYLRTGNKIVLSILLYCPKGTSTFWNWMVPYTM